MKRLQNMRSATPEIPSCLTKGSMKGFFTYEGFNTCSRYCIESKWIHVMCKFCCQISTKKPTVAMEGSGTQGNGRPKKSKDGDGSMIVVIVAAVLILLILLILLSLLIPLIPLILVPGLIWVVLKLTRTDNPRNPEIGLELLRLNREDGDDDAGQEANAAGQDKVKDQNDANEGPQAEGRDEAEDQDEAEDRDEVEDWGDAEDQDEAANGNGEQNADAGQNEADENNGNGGLFHAIPRDNAVEHSEPIPHQATN